MRSWGSSRALFGHVDTVQGWGERKRDKNKQNSNEIKSRAVQANQCIRVSSKMSDRWSEVLGWVPPPQAPVLFGGLPEVQMRRAPRWSSLQAQSSIADSEVAASG